MGLHNATKTRQVIRRKEVDTFPESHTLGNINKGLNINFVTLPLTMAKTFQVSSTICVLMCVLYTAYAQNATTAGAPTGNTNVTAQVNVTAQPIVNVTAQVCYATNGECYRATNGECYHATKGECYHATNGKCYYASKGYTSNGDNCINRKRIKCH